MKGDIELWCWSNPVIERDKFIETSRIGRVLADSQ